MEFPRQKARNPEWDSNPGAPLVGPIHFYKYRFNTRQKQYLEC